MSKIIKREDTEEIVTSDSSDSSSDSDISSVNKKPDQKMSEKITLSVLTKFIKPYQGDRESLPAFLTNCENAISLASTEQQNVLCKYILSQLEGKAQLACCIKKFSNWSDIKQFLKSTFGEKKHSTHLLVDLQNCKQAPSEDVTQFSIRIESCLTRLQSDIHYSCEDDKELLGRLAAMEDLALNTFLLGLNTNFSHIVRCRNPKTLSEAITHATEEEKLYKLSKLSQRSSKQCTICQKFGHISTDCYYKNKLKNNSNQKHYSNHHVNSNSQNNNPHSNKNKTCAYCKKPGHLISECFKLKSKNNNSNNNVTLSGANAPGSSKMSNNNHSNVHHVSSTSDEDLN